VVGLPQLNTVLFRDGTQALIERLLLFYTYWREDFAGLPELPQQARAARKLPELGVELILAQGGVLQD
jgi:hypothetical protein